MINCQRFFFIADSTFIVKAFFKIIPFGKSMTSFSSFFSSISSGFKVRNSVWMIVTVISVINLITFSFFPDTFIRIGLVERDGFSIFAITMMATKMVYFSFYRRWFIIKGSFAKIANNIYLREIFTNAFSFYKTPATRSYTSTQTISSYNSIVTTLTKAFPLSGSIFSVISPFYNSKKSKSSTSQILYLHLYHPIKLYQRALEMSIHENPELLEVQP